MKKAIFITVRTNSTRLPGKALLKINGKSTIELVINRAKKSQKAELIVLCTTEEPADNVLCETAERHGIFYFRGSTEDKLMRWKGATEKYGVEFFVTFDGDDLLCDPDLADLAFDQYERNKTDFIQCKSVPCGAFTYGIKTEALNKVCEMKGTTDTEMMVPYFTETGLFRVEELEDVPEQLKRPEIRMTLDYKEDLRFFKAIYTYFTNPALWEVLKFLDEHPNVCRINAHLQEMYLYNQRQKARVVLK